MNRIGSVKGKSILFLQGPMGLFFKRVDSAFRAKGAQTYRIGFNMGDYIFSYKDNYTAFRGNLEEWPDFIENFLLQKQIEKIFLFGDCRYYQYVARNKAYEHNIEVYVFEEGYLRPHYITLEKFGVNGFSQLSRDSEFYNTLPFKKIPDPEHARTSKTKMIFSAIIYYGIANIFWFRYPYYMHHRDFSATLEAYNGIRGLFRKILYFFTEKEYSRLIQKDISGKYYFIPLQTYNDFQVLKHSPYRDIEKFILEILESFSCDAPDNTFLVFKHHPVDRGRRNYNRFIQKHAKRLGLAERVYVFHDVFLPACLKHAKATITINSTVGLSSIAHGIPTLTLGTAVYDIEGLTNHNKSLKDFWHQYEKPNNELFLKYKQYLVENTQLNGSFYGLMPKEL